MAKYVNSFALLDDEEGDDVDVLVDRIVKKVDDVMHAQIETQSSVFEQNGNGGRNGGRNGGQGRRDGSRGNGDGFQGADGSNDGLQGGDGWNDGRGPYENGYGRVRGRGQGQGRSGGDDWQGVSKGPGKGYDNRGRSYGDEQRSYRNEYRSYDSERRGHGEHIQDNCAGGGQRRYRNGNQNYSERRGFENQGQDYRALDGQRRYRNERRSYDGERRGYEDQVLDDDANSEQLSRNVNVNEDSMSRDEERKYRNENRNRSGGRRGYGGNRGAGSDYRRTGSGELKENKIADAEHDVKADHVNGSGGEAEMVLEPSKAAETEEQNTSVEVTGDIRDPKEVTEEQKMKDERKERELKRKEEEMKEAALMTLDQYEKLLLEKRKALETSKTELRTVSIDKELEGMQLIQKKADASDEARKSEEENLKKDGSLEKKEKNRKLEAEKLHELFKPAFRRRSTGGRGQGRDGSGDQGGFLDKTNNGGPRTNGDAAAARVPAPRRMRIPTARDFPVLGASPSAAVPAPAPEIRSTAPVKRST